MKSIANRKKNESLSVAAAHHSLLQRRQKRTIFALSLAYSLFRTVARTIIQTEGIGRRGLLGTHVRIENLISSQGNFQDLKLYIVEFFLFFTDNASQC